MDGLANQMENLEFEDKLLLHCTKSIRECIPYVMAKIIEWGCPKRSDQSFEDYMKEIGVYTANKLRKFNGQEVKLRKSDTAGLDVTFLYELIGLVCKHIEPRGSDAWKVKQNDTASLEYLLRRATEFRNKLVHEEDTIKKPETMCDVERVCYQILDAGEYLYRRPAKESKEKLNEMFSRIKYLGSGNQSQKPARVIEKPIVIQTTWSPPPPPPPQPPVKVVVVKQLVKYLRRNQSSVRPNSTTINKSIRTQSGMQSRTPTLPAKTVTNFKHTSTKPTGNHHGNPIKPRESRPGTSTKPQASRPGTSTKPQASRPGTSTKPQASRPGTSTKPQASRPGTSTKPQASRPGTSTKPQASRPGTSTKPQASRPGTSTKPQASRPGTSTKSQASRPGTSTKPQASRPGTSTKSQASRPGTTRKSPGSNPPGRNCKK